MSFPRYPKYKESGVEWLGEVPEQWVRTSTKHVVSFTTGWTPPTSDDSSYIGDNLWANISDLRSKVICDTAKRVSDEAVRAARAIPSPPGSLLFSFKLSIGEVSFAGKSMYTNEAIATFLPSAELDLRYAYFALPFYLERNAVENIYGAKLLNQELIRSAPLVVPPLREQEMLAMVLEAETRKIDELIVEQQQLINLLQEKQQQTVLRAVSKGLDANVPTKRVCVDGIGDVPSHWEIGPLKRHWSVTDCKHVTADFVADGFPVASIREVQGWWIDLDEAKRTTAEFYDLLIEGDRQPKEGDLIFSRNATVGEVAQVPLGAPQFALGQDVCLLRKHDPRVSTDYLQYVLRSPVVANQLAILMIGSTFKRVNVEEIRCLQVPMPPADEQVAIAEYLASQLDQIEALVVDAEKSIALLRERRSALISAAVTGKIDVRNYARDQAEAA